MNMIGITGSMASGKTTVAGMFGKLGAAVIDADRIAKALLSKKDIKNRLVGMFGKKILTKGRVDRKKLAIEIFRDEGSFRSACDIIHPQVIEKIRSELNDIQAKNVVVDAPLLIESGLHIFMDKIIVVGSKKASQLERARGRGFKKSDTSRRMKFQMPFKEKLNYADFVINNDRSIKDTERQVLKIWDDIK